MQLVTLQNQQQTSRIHRRPQHPFNVDLPPQVLSPIGIAPVLPAETLANTFMEMRAVSDPLVNSILGWSMDVWLFYVKIRDLQDTALTDIFIDKTNTAVDIDAADASARFFYDGPNGGGVNWLNRCYKRIIQTWFKHDRETWDSDNSVQLRKRRNLSMLDSAVLASALEGGALPTTMGALSEALDVYEAMRAMEMVDMSFEEWCKSFGVDIPTPELNEPELLGHWKDWTYPSNTIDPTDGSPSSACSWLMKNGLKDRKFFREPGFIVAIACPEPKRYNSAQVQTYSAKLNQAFSWLPAIMSDDPATSLREVNGQELISTLPDEDIIVDIRDLFIHGEQFVNHDVSNDMNGFQPASLDGMEITTNAERNALFVGGAGSVLADGFFSFDIVGKQRDMTRNRLLMGA